MNVPVDSTLTPANPAEGTRFAVLQRFKAEDIQHLEQNELLEAQRLAGHGDVWGVWKTPKSIWLGNIDQHMRNIDIAQRLRKSLIKERVVSASLSSLIDEGVIHLTRLALLARLAPSSSKSTRLKPSSISLKLYQYWPIITALAIRRKAGNPDAAGLMGCLNDDDVRQLKEHKRTRVELERIDKLVAMGLWSDAPQFRDITQITDPSGVADPRLPQSASVPYLPIPDKYMAEIGPRILWIVRDLATHLLRLLEAIPAFMRDVDWSLSTVAIAIHLRIFIADHLQQYPWKDRMGQPLIPTFPFITAHENRGGHEIDICEWPPRTWSHIKILSQTLQAAHLFIMLLASAGRIGEVATLKRDCVVTACDGKDYLEGWTYKLSGNLFGDVRQWPAPELLVKCAGQQARLAEVWHKLPRAGLAEVLPEKSADDGRLWVSLATTGGKVVENSAPTINHALMMLAQRVGMDPMPGGKNLHAHRFRKTIGRLAGIALFNSPLVLKRLFGHKSIEMTLHYILCNPDIRTEAENVLRELRIMHCAEALEEIHVALAGGTPLPGNGGAGAERLVQTVEHEQVRLTKAGQVWDKCSANDLAFLLTANGQGWRLIKENIVCSKAPGEDGLCQKKRSKGEPNTANCQPECNNRIVLMRQRRDTGLVIEQYLDIARKARDDGQLLVLVSVMENLRDELENFADLKEQYLADTEVQSLFALCDEPVETEEIKESV